MPKPVAFNFSPDEIDRIVAALSLLQDVDDQNGLRDEAKTTRDLIDKIQSGEATIA